MAKIIKQYPTFNPIVALATAYAAQRINKQYLKSPVFDDDTETVVQYSNKHLMKSFLNPASVDPVVKITVTDEDLQNAVKAVKFFNRYTFAVLSNTLSDFAKQLWEMIERPVRSNELGNIAYVPQFIENELKDNKLKDEVSVICANSKPYTTFPGGVIKIIKSVYSHQYGFYRVTGIVDGNLVWFNSNNNGAEVNKQYRITGKSKSIGYSEEFRMEITKLNYVKLSKV